MFRKIAHILLIAVLLISTMGFSLSKHYCGTRLVEVKINSEAKSCCGNGCKSNCCHNETIHFQLKDNFVGSPGLEISPALPTDLVLSSDLIAVLFSPQISDIDSFIEKAESPPPKTLHTKLSEIQSYLL